MAVQKGIGRQLFAVQIEFTRWLIAVWNDFDIRKHTNFIAFIMIFYVIRKRGTRCP